MKNKKLLKVIYASLFAAIICVVTLFPQIPVPATGGYIHMGDAVLLVAAWLFGPLYGTLAAAFGSFLADVFSGYIIYAPATLVIKGLVALCAVLFVRFTKKFIKSKPLCYIISAVVAELIMVLGYFLYELCLYGGGAVAAIPANLIQGGFAVVAGVFIIRLLVTNKTVKEFILN